MHWLVIASIMIAFVLSVVPTSFDMRLWRPEFVALVVIYWSMYSSEHFGVFMAWCCGLLHDIIELSPMGYSALGLVVVAYISHLSYQRIRSYALWQQAVWVFILVGIYQLLGNWVNGLMDKEVESPTFLIAAMITAFLWPLVVVTMRSVKIRFRIP
ncbi:rod shape-determining protein MreD [Candidatus Endobugula sertula]|uniref:Rod shape-determining protein MreD n=1 Tax=Candidatus Endobugula sertula TaxID=62101 RepID=A0A1D2QQU7_9GAMM|nr:rod shape-determining protein MreD [Candidatus Endobugula sertula]